MKKKTFNSMLLTFGITVLTTCLWSDVRPYKSYIDGFPVEENDINPLSDINAQRSE